MEQSHFFFFFFTHQPSSILNHFSCKEQNYLSEADTGKLDVFKLWDKFRDEENKWAKLWKRCDETTRKLHETDAVSDSTHSFKGDLIKVW